MTLSVSRERVTLGGFLIGYEGIEISLHWLHTKDFPVHWAFYPQGQHPLRPTPSLPPGSSVNAFDNHSATDALD